MVDLHRRYKPASPNWLQDGTIAAASGLAFLGLSLYFLVHHHPHEDAYILFIYARNWADGLGVCFSPKTGPTEGATDFLFMAMIALFTKMGLSPALGAATLNSLGMALGIGHIRSTLRGLPPLLLTLAQVAFAVSSWSIASLGGFSALFYCGIWIACSTSVLSGHMKAAAFWGLLVCLTRPDGLVLVIPTLAVALVRASSAERRALWRHSAICAIIASSYFLVRWQYFGHLLPLPLIVKSKSDLVLPGITSNYLALKWWLPFMAICGVGVFKFDSKHRTDLLTLLAGPFSLLAALSLAMQTQNIAHRFQAPIMVSLLVGGLLAGSRLVTRRERHPRTLSIETIILATLLVLPIARGARNLRASLQTKGQYIDHLGTTLREIGPHMEKIAITEAGRLPYQLGASYMVDLVGLNSPECANGRRIERLNALAPELIFVHAAGQVAVPYAKPAIEATRPWRLVPTQSLEVASAPTSSPVALGTRAGIEYALSTGRYRCVAVQYGGKWDHLFFLSDTIDIQKFTESIERSHQAQGGLGWSD